MSNAEHPSHEINIGECAGPSGIMDAPAAPEDLRDTLRLIFEGRGQDLPQAGGLAVTGEVPGGDTGEKHITYLRKSSHSPLTTEVSGLDLSAIGPEEPHRPATQAIRLPHQPIRSLQVRPGGTSKPQGSA